jgi:glycine cleavage system aminomethyltransferase T
MLNVNESYTALRNSAGVAQMPGRLLRLDGAGHRDLLSWLLARATEYSHPGTSVWSLVLDADGGPAGTALAVIDESEDLLVLDAPGEWLDAAMAAAPASVRDGARISPVDGFAIAVEGPRSWSVVAPLSSQPITDLLINEVTAASLEGRPVRLARTGTTDRKSVV